MPRLRDDDRADRRRRPRYALLPALPAAARRHGAWFAPPPRRDRPAALGQAGRLGGAGPVSDRAPAPAAAAGVARSPVPPRLYIVLTRVPRRTALAVGSLGTVTLERGWYAYVGSAARAREARVARHLALEKPLRWHADYLFTAFPAERAWLVDGAAGECDLAGALAAAARRGAPAAPLRRRRLPLRRPPRALRAPALAPRPGGRGARRRRAAERGGTGLRPPPRLPPDIFVLHNAQISRPVPR